MTSNSISGSDTFTGSRMVAVKVLRRDADERTRCAFIVIYLIYLSTYFTGNVALIWCLTSILSILLTVVKFTFSCMGQSLEIEFPKFKSLLQKFSLK